jgi:hypothetical protein
MEKYQKISRETEILIMSAQDYLAWVGSFGWWLLKWKS